MMNKYKLLALASFLAGLALFGAGILIGETKVYLAVIIPIIETASILSVIGILLIFTAFFLWMVGTFTEPAGVRNYEGKIKAGGVIMIGPVPIIFSNDKRLTIILAISGIVLVTALVVLSIFYF